MVGGFHAICPRPPVLRACRYLALTSCLADDDQVQVRDLSTVTCPPPPRLAGQPKPQEKRPLARQAGMLRSSARQTDTHQPASQLCAGWPTRGGGKTRTDGRTDGLGESGSPRLGRRSPLDHDAMPCGTTTKHPSRRRTPLQMDTYASRPSATYIKPPTMRPPAPTTQEPRSRAETPVCPSGPS